MEYQDLVQLGIKATIQLGRNAFGFNEKVVITNDDRQWDYIPEDNYYEERTENLLVIAHYHLQ